MIILMDNYQPKSTAILLGFVLFFVQSCAGYSTTKHVQLRVLETADIHVHIVDYDYFQDQPSPTVGLAKTAALIRTARAEVANSVLVDNGDLLQGNPLGDYIARQRGLDEGEIHPVYKAMNLLDYDVANIGNHEFNFGLDFLKQSIAGANFPYISANVFHAGDEDGQRKPFFDQYVLIDKQLVAADGSKHAIKIGFIGFVPPQIMQWDMSNLAGRVVAEDIVDTARQLIPKMKSEGADIIVAIPHSGFATKARSGMDENAVFYLSDVPGIDAIMFGHSHQVFPSGAYASFPKANVENGTINGIPSTMPGFWGSHLGIVDLDLRVSPSGQWQVLGGTGETRAIYRQDTDGIVALVEPVEEIIAAVQTDHLETIDYVGTHVGEISVPLNSFFSLVQDDASVQIVTDAQKLYVERLLIGTELDGMTVLSASAPFKTGGRGGNGYFTDIDAGAIALKHVADLYVYPNTLTAVKLNGAAIREWLEMAAGVFNQIDPNILTEQELIDPTFSPFNFDVIDGISYRIDVTKPPRYDNDGVLINPDSRRIVAIRHNGESLDLEKEFIVATNNYRAGGGGGFPGLDGSNIVIGAPDTNRGVLANYILEQKTISPTADGNWRFEPIDEGVNVTFLSSPKADKLLSPESQIQLLRIEDSGAARYRISF